MKMIVQNLGMPIYLQVKAYILEKIRNGQYIPGDKLPTERDLSKEIGISRNTVSAAYKELMLEGVLESKQGRGTFVRDSSASVADLSAAGNEAAGSRLDRALRVIDQAMVQVVELGFSVDEFATIAGIRAKAKAETVKALRVAMVECTEEYFHRFLGQIGQVSMAQFEKVLLDDLMNGKVKADLLNACDLVITTVEHQNVVATYLNQPAKLAIISAGPSLDAVIKMARLPAHACIGVVARSDNFIAALERLLNKIGCGGIQLQSLLLDQNIDERGKLQDFVSRHRVLVVAEALETQVRQVVTDQDVIPFYYEIDQGSLQQVMARLVDAAGA